MVGLKIRRNDLQDAWIRMHVEAFNLEEVITGIIVILDR